LMLMMMMIMSTTTILPRPQFALLPLILTNMITRLIISTILIYHSASCCIVTPLTWMTTSTPLTVHHGQFRWDLSSFFRFPSLYIPYFVPSVLLWIWEGFLWIPSMPFASNRELLLIVSHIYLSDNRISTFDDISTILNMLPGRWI
jgi:hypothetical protein